MDDDDRLGCNASTAENGEIAFEMLIGYAGCFVVAFLDNQIGSREGQIEREENMWRGREMVKRRGVELWIGRVADSGVGMSERVQRTGKI